MPLPSQGDPQRPIELAVRSVRLLAVLFLLMSATAALFILPRLAQGHTGPMERAMGAFAILFYLGPGALYLVLAIYLRQRRAWAVTTGLVVASIQLALTLVGVVGLFLRGSASLAVLVVFLLVAAALGQLIQHLSQSYAAVRAWAGEAQRGFEVGPAAAVLPVEDDDAGQPI